jgi:protein-tyrosine phosphatase
MMLRAALHGVRRRAAIARLRATPTRAVLVVCHGNLCRSPYAERVLRRELSTAGVDVPVTSAGFAVPQLVSPPHALAAAAQRGIDMSAHRSRLVSRAELAAADLVVVMDPRQVRAVEGRSPAMRVVVLGDLDPDPAGGRRIDDPFGRDAAAFDACYERIDRCVRALVEPIRAVTGRRASASPGSSST